MAAKAERSSYNAFERFLYLFLIPCLFTLILTGVLLALFGYNIKDSLLKFGHSIPVLSKVVPVPASHASSSNQSAQTESKQTDLLKAKLSAQSSQLTKDTESLKQKDQQIKDLQAKIADLQAKLQQKTQTFEEYQKKLKDLADIYTNMKPTAAAAIMSNLSMPELILVLNQMTLGERANILSNMNPQIAAQASIEMKDTVPVKDQAIAALQARLKLNEAHNPSSSNANISLADEAKTFSSMPPKNAAEVLLKMADSNESKVVSILSVMDTGVRSAILTAMDGISADGAAKIADKLGK